MTRIQLYILCKLVIKELKEELKQYEINKMKVL